MNERCENCSGSGIVRGKDCPVCCDDSQFIEKDWKQEVEKQVDAHMDNWRYDNTRLIGMPEEDREHTRITLKLAEENHNEQKLLNIHVLTKTIEKCGDRVSAKESEISRLKQDVLDAFREGEKQGKYKERQAMIARIEEFAQKTFTDEGNYLQETSFIIIPMFRWEELKNQPKGKESNESRVSRRGERYG